MGGANCRTDLDPFATGGLFERMTITRWRKAYLGGECYL